LVRKQYRAFQAISGGKRRRIVAQPAVEKMLTGASRRLRHLRSHLLSSASPVGAAAEQQPKKPTLFKPAPAFDAPSEVRIDETEHTDEQVELLLSTLLELLAQNTEEETWQADSRLDFWRFQNRIAQARLSDAQEATVCATLDELAAAHPTAAESLRHRKWMIQNLGIGKTAPDITGSDLDGVEFSLSEEARGKVTYLAFSGAWCGPCRSEYPYQRLMLELYDDKPFALLGVNSDSDAAEAKESKAEHRLPYRVWWDGHLAAPEGTEGPRATEGPIATEWGIVGWPSECAQ
jgi:peroxiredoxin